MKEKMQALEPELGDFVNVGYAAVGRESPLKR